MWYTPLYLKSGSSSSDDTERIAQGSRSSVGSSVGDVGDTVGGKVSSQVIYKFTSPLTGLNPGSLFSYCQTELLSREG